MQFQFRVDQQVQPDKQGMVVLHGHQIAQRLKGCKGEGMRHLAEIITAMGQASAKAQSLKQVITTFQRFVGTDNRIYMKVEEHRVLGLLKVGEKNLFHRDYIGSIKEIKPTCVLDFYVHESCQRTGVGKEIFHRFLQDEKKHPAKLAYDRPSEKLLSFLKKHYGLAKFIPQNNNYVVFNQYFEPLKETLQPTISTGPNVSVRKESSPPRTKQVLKVQQQPKEIVREDDTIDQLRKEFSTMYSKESKKYELSSPWAQSMVDRSQFRTTSNTYGSHYK